MWLASPLSLVTNACIVLKVKYSTNNFATTEEQTFTPQIGEYLEVNCHNQRFDTYLTQSNSEDRSLQGKRLVVFDSKANILRPYAVKGRVLKGLILVDAEEANHITTANNINYVSCSEYKAMFSIEVKEKECSPNYDIYYHQGRLSDKTPLDLFVAVDSGKHFEIKFDSSQKKIEFFDNNRNKFPMSRLDLGHLQNSDRRLAMLSPKNAVCSLKPRPLTTASGKTITRL